MEKSKGTRGMMLAKEKEQDGMMLAKVKYEKSQVSLHQRLEGGRSPMK